MAEKDNAELRYLHKYKQWGSFAAKVKRLADERPELKDELYAWYQVAVKVETFPGYRLGRIYRT